MKTLTLSPKLLKHLGAIEVGSFVVFPLDGEFGGGWRVEGIENHKEVAHTKTIEEALAFIETYLED
jgi:hypothetical protein